MKAKLLVIDDDRDTLNLVEMMLQSLGCEVTLAEDGSEALAALKDPESAREYDAIFLDLMMPKINGFEVIEQLKDSEHTASIPVIMLTSKDTSNDVIVGYQHGADYYIPKPFTTAQLAYGIDMVLNEREEPECYELEDD